MTHHTNLLRGASAAISSTLLAVLGFATTDANAQAGTEQPGLDVVLPAGGYDLQRGPLATSYPFNRAPMRVLYAYAGEASSQKEPMRVRGIAFRTWAPTNGVASWSFRLDVSTGRYGPGNLARRFDDNHGADQVTVHQGNLLYDMNSNALDNQPFEIVVPFDESFTWNPSAGPLLLDFRMRGRGGVATNCDIVNTSPSNPAFARIASLSNSEAFDADYPASGVHPVGLVAQLILEDETLPAGADSELNSSTAFPFNRAAGDESRTQLVYDGTLFSPGRRTINRLGFRPNAGAPYTGRTYDVKVTLSTGAPGLSSNASNVFGDNHGDDRTIVFDGEWTTPSLDGTQALAYTLELPLARGFDYDPAKGALVIDIQVRDSDGSTSTNLDGVSVGSGCARVFASSSHNAITGASQPFGLAVSVHGVAAPTFPTDYATSISTLTTGYPFRYAAPCRVQNVYEGSAFGVNAPTTITHLSWRVDTAGVTATTWELTVDLATGSRAADSLSDVFSANVQSDAIRAFDGEVSTSQQNYGDMGWFTIQLDRPFRWDPSRGPLVVDMRKPAGFVGLAPNGYFDAARGDDVGRVVNATDHNAVQATLSQNVALVLQLGGYGHGAVATTYGVGCGSSHGVPVTSTRGMPDAGNVDFAFTAQDLRPSSIAVLGLGLSRSNLALDVVGFAGCTMLSSMNLGTVQLAVDINGEAVMPAPIALDTTLLGLRLAVQTFVADPTASNGLTASQGLEVVLGG